MEDAKVGLQAALRALRDVVAPAIDPDNAQAREQLRLSMDYLAFVVERIDHVHERALVDVRHLLGVATDLRARLSARDSAATATLSAAIAGAEDILPSTWASVTMLRGAGDALARAVTDVVHAAAQYDPALRGEVERCILHASQPGIRFERAWYGPLGLDPDTHHAPGLEKQLRDVLPLPVPPRGENP